MSATSERASWRSGVWTDERSDGCEGASWRGGVWTEERSDEGRRREQRRASERTRQQGSRKRTAAL